MKRKSVIGQKVFIKKYLIIQRFGFSASLLVIRLFTPTFLYQLIPYVYQLNTNYTIRVPTQYQLYHERVPTQYQFRDYNLRFTVNKSSIMHLISFSYTRAVPPVGGNSPHRILMVVVFPAPLWPRNEVIWSSYKFSDSPSTANYTIK